MARIIHPRSLRPPKRSRWWSTLIAGAAVGAAAAWLVLRRERPTLDDEADELSPRPLGAPKQPDLDAMTARLRAHPGAQGLRLRSLGGGILELVGSAEAELDVSALLATLAAEPRVSVVVNRVWMPEAPQPGEDGDTQTRAPSSP
ncbi:MAG: hypothetical protein EXR95_08100 [Gemmatimonadetes bacterium]|nr:hypothetical protein [Gemmatimonadota bacterium]